MASGAYGIVEQARRADDLKEALNDCLMSVGTSARIGRKRITASSPAEVIPELLARAVEGPVACVFGRESKGLSNEEMRLCTHHMVIPTDMEFASMNVAHACAVTAYEIFKRTSRPMGFKAVRFVPASVSAREEMYEHIEQVLVRAGFLDPSNPLHMMRDLRRILNSAGMDDRDVKIIRGVFRKIGNMVRIADEKVKSMEQRLRDS
jgi:TrmH family RNA methyltransferase